MVSSRDFVINVTASVAAEVLRMTSKFARVAISDSGVICFSVGGLLGPFQLDKFNENFC